ncbi:MAG: peptide/nickel transport system substrate-binding protein [Pseudonocardiales bacterium]|nr:peptide/nickel transport system substrate-binding protein [Pseudonocardiales bacterium]
MTIGSATGIDLLNPVLQTTAWDQVLFSLLWNGLVTTGKDGKLQPDLASSWSASADQKSWTFQLRPGVKFSNGKALTPADVASTLAYYQNPNTATEQKNNVAQIAAVKPSGSNAVVFTLKAPNAVFPNSISRLKIVDMAALSGMEKNPAVTGPFKVKEFVADDHLTLVRNPSYFGSPAKLDSIKIVKAPDSSAALTALQSGDLDALWSVPLSQVAAIQANPKLAAVKPSVIGQYVSWEVDTTQAPFNNVKARQALAYAIDQKSILSAAYSGQGSVSTTNDPLANNNPNYGGNLTDYTYNLDKAKALFAQAGVNAGSTLTWWGVANQYPEWNISAQILQASLKKIGINLKIQNTDISSWPSRFYPAGKSFPGLIIPNFQSYTSDASDEFQFMLHGRCECNWNNDQFDALYKNALATADPTAQKALWQKAQELINQQAPIFVPVQFATVTATKSSVVGLWVDSAGNPHLEDAGFTG